MFVCSMLLHLVAQKIQHCCSWLRTKEMVSDIRSKVWWQSNFIHYHSSSLNRIAKESRSTYNMLGPFFSQNIAPCLFPGSVVFLERIPWIQGVIQVNCTLFKWIMSLPKCMCKGIKHSQSHYVMWVANNASHGIDNLWMWVFLCLISLLLQQGHQRTHYY